MQSRKRSKVLEISQAPTKKHRYNDSASSVRQKIWKCLPRLSEREMDIENTIKHSHLFIKLTSNERDYLQSILKGIKDVIDDSKYTFHSECVELKNFHITDCCVLLPFFMINLNKFWNKSNDSDSCSITKPFYVRCSVYVFKSCQILQIPVFNKKTTFHNHLAHVSGVPGFKQIEFQSADLKDLMGGIVHQISNWKFHPSKTPVHKRFIAALSNQNNVLRSVIEELPIYVNLIDMDLVAKVNIPAIERSKKNMEDYAIKLQEYNNKVSVKDIKPTDETKTQKDTVKSSKYSNLMQQKHTTSRYQGTSKRHTPTPNAMSSQDKRTTHHYASSEDIKSYCMATIKATIDVVSSKSAYQITRAYVKYPRTCIDSLYQKLAELRNESNCNIVILNIQTVHESTAWFENLNTEEYASIVPPPSAVRVISIGGVGENCKRALRLLQNFLENISSYPKPSIHA
ncbi:Snu56p Ecym_5115 [Eremothecium cymbalariae DBVPG|uniref:Uncharacterized protein n=1 Tax=Eremothecium cymbalariae (strain CBS 270.75 / DBVPG 7215 / KCTC 17166 / NRRL Y-17582) TaxID=931890 RepID=I6NCV3_ERECY|nr:hypothetical protein Ecym_5115 [Eremothecium cymbalariae DBVPG\